MVDEVRGIKRRVRHRIVILQKRGRKNMVAKIGRKQGTLNHGKGPPTVMVKIARKKGREIGRQVAKMTLTEKEKEQRMRRVISQGISPQVDTKEGVHHRMVTGVNEAREAL